MSVLSELGVRRPHHRLRLGQVVVNTTRPKERGVVVRAQGRGAPSTTIFGPIRTGECAIMLGPGTYIVTSDQDDDWAPVPAAETSAVERVRSAMCRYERPTWLRDGEEPRDADSFPFALVRALLPPDVADDPMAGDVPSFCDLVELVAERFDTL